MNFWAMTTTGPGDGDGDRNGYALAAFKAIAEQGLRAGADLHVFEDAHRRGEAWNFLRALRRGLEFFPNADRLTILEDDIEICRGFVARVEAQPVPDDCAFIAWFDSFLGRPATEELRAGPPLPAAPGFVRRISAHFYCLQAVTFSRRAAEEIVGSTLARMWPHRNEGDQLVARVLRHQDYAVHVPSLVQHVGATSLCNPGEPLKVNRISHHYAGRDFDAGTLGVFT